MSEDVALAVLAPLGRDLPVPVVVADAGEEASRHFLEFFAATIRNRNTRAAYARAVAQFFSWCELRHVGLDQLEPLVVAAYIEQHPGAPPTVNQHLAAIKMLCDHLVRSRVLRANPAATVRGPKHVVKRGKTPVLAGSEAKSLLDSIEPSTIIGLRDRALISVMVYTFGRVGAVIRMRVEDYFPQGKRWWIRLHEKGGKRHDVPAHHLAEAAVDAYLDAGGIRGEPRSPLFRSVDRHGRLSDRGLAEVDVLRMVKRRARAAGLPDSTCCHTFRATGITAYLQNGGTLEKAQQIANHESPRTTKLYDRSSDVLTLEEIERISL